MSRVLLREGSMLLALWCVAAGLLWWSYQPRRQATFDMATPKTVLRRDDFYNLETFEGSRHTFRWTDGSASITAPNPGGPFVLQLVLASGPAGRVAPVRVGLGDQELVFDVGAAPRMYAMVAPPSQAERVTAWVKSPTIHTATRKVGVIVGDVSLLGGGSLPSRLLLPLVGAIAGGYVFLRRAGLRPPAAAGMLTSLLAIVLWGSAAGGWRYALLGPLLTLVGAAGAAGAAIGRQDVTIGADAASARPLRRDDVALIGLLLLGALALRLPWLTARDPIGDLEMAARRMGFLYSQGLSAAYINNGDYLPLRLYLLRGLAPLVVTLGGRFYDPVSPVTQVVVKLPSLLADLATIGLLYAWGRRWRGRWAALGIAALYASLPPVWIDSAWWGQVDALLMLPLVAAVMMLDRRGAAWSWACWALALLLKPQAIIIAPLLFVATARLHGRGALLRGAGLATALLVCGCVPLVLAGEGPGLMQAYLGSVERFPRLTNGAYNVWYLFTQGKSVADVGQGLGPLSFRAIGFGLVGLATLAMCATLLRRADMLARLRAAACLALAFFLLPTQIHERYIVLSLAFLALLAMHETPMLIPLIGLTLTGTTNILGTLSGFAPELYSAIRSSPLPVVFPIANMLIFAALLVDLLRHSTRRGEAAYAETGGRPGRGTTGALLQDRGRTGNPANH